MASAGAADRILPATRVLSALIIPFLVAAFVLLFFFPSPDDTGRRFAWRIVPSFTAMMLGAVYLGGSYFFARAVAGRSWRAVGGGFLPVGTFATLMGVATLLHWDRFAHANVAFWIWAVLYFTTPFAVFAVWWRNQRRESTPAAAGTLLLSRPASLVVAGVGAVALLTAIFLFAFPAAAQPIWPWSLTPLTSRVVGAMFVLGGVGAAALPPRPWASVRILLQVAGVMLVLIVVAVLRARADFRPQQPLTWIFAVGVVLLAVAGTVLYVRMERRAARLAG